MLLRSENKVVWIHGANVLFLSVILMVLLGPLEIRVIQFCVCVRLLDYYPQAAGACMATNVLSEVDVMWQVSKCDDQSHVFYRLNLLIWLNSQCIPEFYTGQN